MTSAAVSSPGPARRDPRPWFASLLGLYLLLGLTVLGFGRSPMQALLTTGTAVVADFLLNLWLRPDRGGFPWSGLITGFGLCLLLDYGSNPWLPVVPPLLAIASKHLFTVNGRHGINPGLFGLIVGMRLTGGMLCPAPAYQWGGSAGIAFLVGGLALAVFVGRIRRNWLIFSFLGFYTLQMLLRAWIMRFHLSPEAIILGTISSPPFFLFTFYMLTDPMTSPSSPRGQVILALGVTLLDLVFHLKQSYSTLFPALFLIQAGMLVAGWIGTMVRGRVAWKSALVRLPVVVVLVLFVQRFAVDDDASAPAGFRFVEHKEAAFQEPMGKALEEVDPRLRHVAKWVLSVGDAAACADVDGDGKLDVFLTNPLKEPSRRLRLYRNLGGLKFEELKIPALDKIRNDPATYGLPSCAVFADFDNDGDQDLFIGMGFGPSRLLKNMRMETGRTEFVDVTDEAGLSGSTTCVAAVFFDADLDGKLDLLVCNSMNPMLPDYDPPVALNPFKLPQPAYEGDRRMFHFMHSSWNNAENGGRNVFYHNRGDGTFEKKDIAAMGMPETHWTLAVNIADFNGDGWPDIYEASDFGPDDIYLNRGGSRFERVAGKTFGSIGNDTYKGMNTSIADFDGDGYPDVYVSNVHAPLQAEGSLLWMTKPDGHGGATFRNEAAFRGALNVKRFGWGAGVADLDRNGWPDLVQANGMADDALDHRFDTPHDYWYANAQLARTGPDVHSYADRWGDMRGYTIWGNQRNRVLMNDHGQFRDAAITAGLDEMGNARGVMLADLDNDGDADLVLTRQYAPSRLFENQPDEATSKRGWIGLELEGDGVRVARDAANVKLAITCGTRVWHVETQNVSGFSAQGDRRVLLGLGDEKWPVNVGIDWKPGLHTDAGPLEPGRYHHLTLK